MHDQLKARHPFPEGIDFTTVLPRWMSIRIFSYLDPSSLSKCSLVSHAWKNITEDDSLWAVHCIERNWMLQSQPSKYERATFKRLFSTMNYQTQSTKNYWNANQPLNGYQMQVLQKESGINPLSVLDRVLISI